MTSRSRLLRDPVGARLAAAMGTRLVNLVVDAATPAGRPAGGPRPSAAGQAALVDRLTGLGATSADIDQGEVTWTALADPEGNELCVLSPH
jgi:hypothetical protein